jgi:hypothetical protein
MTALRTSVHPLTGVAEAAPKHEHRGCLPRRNWPATTAVNTVSSASAAQHPATADAEGSTAVATTSSATGRARDPRAVNRAGIPNPRITSRTAARFESFPLAATTKITEIVSRSTHTAYPVTVTAPPGEPITIHGRYWRISHRAGSELSDVMLSLE